MCIINLHLKRDWLRVRKVLGNVIGESGVASFMCPNNSAVNTNFGYLIRPFKVDKTSTLITG